MWFAPLLMLFAFLVYEKSSFFRVKLETCFERGFFCINQNATYNQAKNTQGLKSHKTKENKSKNKKFQPNYQGKSQYLTLIIVNGAKNLIDLQVHGCCIVDCWEKFKL